MRVLLADDEQDMAYALEAMLKREHYAVDVVFDGKAALEYGETGNYDCLVLDVMMPEIDGVEVVRQIRDRGLATPILLLTAKSEPEDRVVGLDAGADDYLPKPFDMAEFLARVRALTRRSEAYIPSTMQAGDLTLNRATFELSRGDEHVYLGGKEFQIMELLMRNQGRFVPSDLLISRTWGYDVSIEPNVIWTHMSYLRRKIEAVGSPMRIVAGRGRGYALKDPEDGEAQA